MKAVESNNNTKVNWVKEVNKKNHEVTLKPFDDILFQYGFKYTIGTNDGAQFRSVIFTGTKLYQGKPMMTFKTSYDEQQITINPSFHSYTIQETIIETTEPKSEKKEKDNG